MAESAIWTYHAVRNRIVGFESRDANLAESIHDVATQNLGRIVVLVEDVIAATAFKTTEGVWAYTMHEVVFVVADHAPPNTIDFVIRC
jgi:hypothetical protein